MATLAEVQARLEDVRQSRRTIPLEEWQRTEVDWAIWRCQQYIERSSHRRKLSLARRDVDNAEYYLDRAEAALHGERYRSGG